MINLNKGISTPLAITIIIALAVVLVGGVFAYQYYYLLKQETEAPKTETPKDEAVELTKKEQECLSSGGVISTSSYCKDVNEFPDTCSAPRRGCAPEFSHNIKICDCGEGSCFDGSRCVCPDCVPTGKDWKIVKDESTGWNVYKNFKYSFEFKYPDNFFYNNPEVTAIDCVYANFSNECPYIEMNGEKIDKETAMGWKQHPVKIEKVIINNTPYCHWESGDSAAGSFYLNYYYVTTKGKDCFSVSFVIRGTNCGVFLPEEDEYKDCEYRNNVTIPETLKQIISTFRFID